MEQLADPLFSSSFDALPFALCGVPKARRLAPFAHHAPIARLDSPLSLWCFARKAPIFFATLKEMTHARSCPVWPARCALRAARRSEDHETNGRDHPDVGDLRVRVRPVALSRHQQDRPADPDRARV